MEIEHDPDDTRQISFLLEEKDSEWVKKRLQKLKEDDSGFYVQQLDMRNGNCLYKITTKHANMQHEDFKKFMFQVELRLGNKVKVR